MQLVQPGKVVIFISAVVIFICVLYLLFSTRKSNIEQQVESELLNTISYENVQTTETNKAKQLFLNTVKSDASSEIKNAVQENNIRQKCSTSNPNILNLTEPVRHLAIVTSCVEFLDRVKEFSVGLDLMRVKLLEERGGRSWNGPTNGSVAVVWGGDDDFMKQLEKYVEVRTVVLPWLGENSTRWNSREDNSNLLYRDYYEWTASDPLCTWIETVGSITLRYDATYNRTCKRTINKSVERQALKPVFLNMKPIVQYYYWPNDGKSFPEHFYTKPPWFAFYLHIITDALVTQEGNIFTRNIKLVPYGCTNPNYRDPNVLKKGHNQPLYEELFYISQFLGTGIYNRMLEIVPRLVVALDFLKRNKDIKIFAPELPTGRLGELLKILGLNPERVVTEWGRAKVVYLPRVSMCGCANLQEIQILSHIYQRYIADNFQPLQRNKLVVIRRNGARRFKQPDEIEVTLQKVAREYDLDFVLFWDSIPPALNDTMKLFYSAVLVVAPHGAGLSNLVFSQPATYVVEGVCEAPMSNLRYQRLAVILSQHWHGIPSRGGCEDVVDVAPSDLDTVVRLYLEQRKLALV